VEVGAVRFRRPKLFYLRDRVVRPPRSNSVSDLLKFRSNVFFVVSILTGAFALVAPGERASFLRR